MIKLLICLLSATALAGVVLQLRQQRLELAYETAELHDQIRSQQSKLWNQQLLIAASTAPNAIGQAVDVQGLQLVPQAGSAQVPDPASRTPKSDSRARGTQTAHPAPPRRTRRTASQH